MEVSLGVALALLVVAIIFGMAWISRRAWRDRSNRGAEIHHFPTEIGLDQDDPRKHVG